MDSAQNVGHQQAVSCHPDALNGILASVVNGADAKMIPDPEAASSTKPRASEGIVEKDHKGERNGKKHGKPKSNKSAKSGKVPARPTESSPLESDSEEDGDSDSSASSSSPRLLSCSAAPRRQVPHYLPENETAGVLLVRVNCPYP